MCEVGKLMHPTMNAWLKYCGEKLLGLVSMIVSDVAVWLVPKMLVM